MPSTVPFSEPLILLIILGMALVTYLPRFLPAFLLAERQLNPSFERWLSYVPTAVLSALLVPSVLAPEGTFAFTSDNLFLLAALPSLVLAFATRAFFAPMVVGVGLVAYLRWQGLG